MVLSLRTVPIQARRVAFAASLAFYLDAATVICVAISLPVWRDEYALTAWDVGLLGSGLSFAIAAGAVAGGRLGDAIGRGKVFTGDLVIFVLGASLIALAASPGMLLTGVMISGLAAGADIPTALAVIGDVAPEGTQGRLVALTQVMWIAAILLTYALGFLVSRFGFPGIRTLSWYLLVVALATLAMRLSVGRPAVHERTATSITRASWSRLGRPAVLWPLLATGAFYLFWSIASATLGGFGTYFLVTVTELTLTEATGLVLITFPPALVMSLIFVRLADSPWRDRLFVVAMIVQVAAFIVGAVSGGAAAGGMICLVALYGLSNVFAGEAIYKVWSQLLLPADVRATGVGLTYAAARAVAASVMLLVPTIIETRADALLWLLAGCVAVSGLVGLVITRRREWSGLLRPGG